MTNVQEQHLIETFKSLPQIAIAGLKITLILNGGAAVALLAFLEKSDVHYDMRWPMGCFVIGVTLAALAHAGAYISQLVLFQESRDKLFAKSPNIGEPHKYVLWGSILIAISSIIAFCVGSLIAVSRL